MTWIQEHYYDLRTYLRNLFKSSTEEWLEAELMAVDEALGFTPNSTRRHGDRIVRIESLSRYNQALYEQIEQMKEREAELKASWAEDANKYQEELKTWKEGYELKHLLAQSLKTAHDGLKAERDKLQEELKTWKAAYAHEHQLAEDLYKQVSECQTERDTLKLELRDERKWSQDLARMADERGDKIGKLNDEIETLKNRRSELVSDKMRLVREVETYKDAYNTLKRMSEGVQE